MLIKLSPAHHCVATTYWYSTHRNFVLTKHNYYLMHYYRVASIYILLPNTNTIFSWKINISRAITELNIYLSIIEIFTNQIKTCAILLTLSELHN